MSNYLDDLDQGHAYLIDSIREGLSQEVETRSPNVALQEEIQKQTEAFFAADGHIVEVAMGATAGQDAIINMLRSA